ncbi:MAG: class IIb bacteriocin, lactobin A/cerein 7B family [candidate division WOR-3 bacterium]
MKFNISNSMFGSRFSAGAEFDFKKINFVLMRNLEQMNLISLTENELLSIQGGGWPVVFTVLAGVGAVYGGIYVAGFITGVGVALVEKAFD